MQTLKLFVTLFIALWLHHVETTVVQLQNLTIDYREVCKVKKQGFLNDTEETNIFSQEMLTIMDVEPADFGLESPKQTK